ncbi:MAG: ketoacyl-ACP synthase III [Spirochaetales bacterium]|nr:ketoacyl-ACP synthase III [Spirochaetales bacterium]
MKDEITVPVYIRSFGFWVPEWRVTNDELSVIVDTDDKWIRSHTGIGARHFAGEHEAASDLAEKAARNAVERAGMNLKDLDCIVVATATPDHRGFPSTACIVQSKLGLKKIPAFDVTAGCTGFIYALEIAMAFLKDNNMRNILVIGAEKLSSIMNWEDRSTCILFGDGAGCAILSTIESPRYLEDRSGRKFKEPGFIDSMLYSEGSGSEYLMVPNGGSKNPIKGGEVKTENVSLYMNGRKVYTFAIKVLSEIIVEMLERNDLTIEDVNWVVPHQANLRIIQAVSKRLKIPMEKFFLNIKDYANTSAASIGIACAEMQEKGLLKAGDVVLTVGFGAGLTYGGNLFVW